MLNVSLQSALLLQVRSLQRGRDCLSCGRRYQKHTSVTLQEDDRIILRGRRNVKEKLGFDQSAKRPDCPIPSQTPVVGQALPCRGAGLAQFDCRRRSSSKKFSRIVAWTVVGSSLPDSGGASTTKRRQSGAMSRFQRALFVGRKIGAGDHCRGSVCTLAGPADRAASRISACPRCFPAPCTASPGTLHTARTLTPRRCPAIEPGAS
jgi:hypothetical protein